MTWSAPLVPTAGISKSEVGRICEDGAFWTQFLRSLEARGLGGVQLVIADAHLGLRQAVGAVMAGAAVQRCRVHFLRKRDVTQHATCCQQWPLPCWHADPAEAGRSPGGACPQRCRLG
jgi:Transposase, Mutator family